MRLAVFTSQFPGRVNTFFARDMRGLLEAGVQLEVFPLYPESPELWRQVPDILGEKILPRNRVHYVSPVPRLRRGDGQDSVRPFLGAAWTATGEALRVGPVPAAKTVYSAVKAWNWSAASVARFDHILGYWGNYAATAAFLFRALRGGREPFSIFLHAGTDLYRDRMFLRQKLAEARHVIVCSDFNRDFLARTFPDLASDVERKIVVHQHGVDLEELPYSVDGRAPRRVLGVGGLESAKGFEFLLQGSAILRDRGQAVEIELVGDGPQRESLERLGRSLRLDGIRFRGWLPFTGARDAIRGACVLVHPSAGLGDGAPNVIKEAMALGTPVVASAIAGIPDLLEGGRCGVLVPPRDPAALADGIGSLLSDAGRRTALAERARRSAESRFDLWKNGRVLAAALEGTRSEASA